MDPAQFAVGMEPGGGLGDADEQQGEPSQHKMTWARIRSSSRWETGRRLIKLKLAIVVIKWRHRSSPEDTRRGRAAARPLRVAGRHRALEAEEIVRSDGLI